MRHLLPLLLLIGCGEPTQPAAPAEPAEPAAPAAPAHDEHAAEAGGHTNAEGDGHAARHGGQQREFQGMHVEGLFQADGVMFYLADGDNNPLSPEGATGEVLISTGSSVVTAPLAPKGDALFAAATLESGKPASAVLTLSRAGQTQSASFETSAVGTTFHDHTAQHGGQVGMWGHYHVELLAKDDAYSVWVTDASRNPVTSGLSGFVVDGAQRLALAADASGGGFTARAEGAGSRPVTVEITVQDQQISLPFQAAPAAGDGHAGHKH